MNKILHHTQMTTDNEVKTILMVDDDSNNRCLFSEILSDLGYNVIEEPDGESALLTIREGARIDLVVTDERMPGISGMELIRALRQVLPSVPVIMMTAYGSIETYFQALSFGAFEYVNKPVGKRELQRIIEAALHEFDKN